MNEGTPVSYTHLDVYKRQVLGSVTHNGVALGSVTHNGVALDSVTHNGVVLGSVTHIL